MKRYDPHSPQATEPGDHPQMGERKGHWKVLVAAWGLAALGVFGAGMYFGVF